MAEKPSSDAQPPVTLSANRFAELMAAEEKLEALEAAGVDNWDGWDYAMQLLAESRAGA